MSSRERPPATAEELEEILRRLQRELGLERWSIELDLETPVESATSVAEVDSSESYEYARIRLAAAWRETPADRWGDWNEPVELVLAHELMHLLLRPIDRAFLATAERLGPDAQALAGETYRIALEAVVDQLARVLTAA